ncbi:family 78 glycoside hydrolase catalytic domain [Streptomyces sp. NPDC050560]|uniref:family 78 glycoside hydrolase catalytic domain n=1 Tax=Streptomyces sp. NPDC050560 TaxID=3365630 RepID=UPI0037B6CF58
MESTPAHPSRRQVVRGAAVAAGALAAGGAGAGGAAAAAGHGGARPVTGALRADDLVDPCGIDDTAPLLSWQVTSPERGERQGAVEVQAASTAAALAAGRPDLWSSGRVEGPRQSLPYGGRRLGSRDLVHWRARTWDTHGRVSAWSRTATFELGLTTPEDWADAAWITGPGWTSGDAPHTALPVLVGEFTARRAVARARLHVAGGGIFVCSVNGEAAGDEVLEPANTVLARHAEYATYDVTRLLRRGRNAVGIRLGTGIDDVADTEGRYTKFTGTMCAPRAVARLEVLYTDGSRDALATGDGWAAAEGPTTLAHWYGGEDHDARRALPGWDLPGTDRSGWDRAAVVGPPAGTTRLTGRAAPPLRVVDTLDATLLAGPAEGVLLYDTGTNAAGWPEITVEAPSGTVVSVYPAERLKDGRVDQSGSGQPVFNTFTGDGRRHIWHPEFVYQGFRYFEVRGVTDGVRVTGARALVIRADNAPGGTFRSSDDVVDGVHRLCDRAIQSNMYSVLTDCPHREKLGWMEQNQLVFGAVARNYDIAAYARGIVRTIADAQLPSGLVPDIAPEYTVFSGGFRDDPNWGSAMILMPWQMYRHYGDTRTLEAHYAGMRGYLRHLDSRAVDGLVVYDEGLGDWAELLSGDARTDVELVANFGYFRATEGMANIAAVLGRDADAREFGAAADAVRDAFRARWYDPEGRTVATGTQASLALALDIGAVPREDEDAVFEALVAAVTANDTHLDVGEIALPSALRVLAAHGRNDLVHTLVTQPTAPGYGYFVAQGATSLPEFWDMANSLNHFMLSAVDEWFSSQLAGIQQADGSAGFRELVVRPAVVGGVTHAAATYESPYGTVGSSWETDAEGVVTLDVRVPFGATATVYVPLGRRPPRPPRGPAGARARGVRTWADGKPYAVFSVGSGEWRFTGG